MAALTSSIVLSSNPALWVAFLARSAALASSVAFLARASALTSSIVSSSNPALWAAIPALFVALASSVAFLVRFAALTSSIVSSSMSARRAAFRAWSAALTFSLVSASCFWFLFQKCIKMLEIFFKLLMLTLHISQLLLLVFCAFFGWDASAEVSMGYL